MPTHLHRDLEGLQRRLLSVGARVEEAVWKSIRSVENRDPELAQEVISGDEEIDRIEVEIEEECLKVLALHQPVAKDLRIVASVLKINNDLERVGDLAVNVAERALYLASQHAASVPAELHPMSQAAMQMLRSSLDAFVNEDVAAARVVRRDDSEVDDLLRSATDRLQEEMERAPESVDPSLRYLSILKCLERIADHATNVAEDVIYLVEGEIVRHPGTIPRTRGPAAPSQA